MLVLDRAKVKGELEERIKLVWDKFAPFSIIEDSKSWTDYLAPEEKNLVVLKNKDNFTGWDDEEEYLKKNLKEKLAELKVYYVILLENESDFLEEIDVSKHFFTFVMSPFLREKGTANVQKKLGDDEYYINLLFLLSTFNYLPVSKESFYIFRVAGYLFPEGCLVQKNNLDCLSQILGGKTDRFTLNQLEGKISGFKASVNKKYKDICYFGGIDEYFPGKFRGVLNTFDEQFTDKFNTNILKEIKKEWSNALKEKLGDCKTLNGCLNGIKDLINSVDWDDSPLIYNYNDTWSYLKNFLEKNHLKGLRNEKEKYDKNIIKFWLSTGVEAVVIVLFLVLFKNLYLLALPVIAFGVTYFLFKFQPYQKFSEEFRKTKKKLTERIKNITGNYVESTFCWSKNLVKKDLEKKANSLQNMINDTAKEKRKISESSSLNLTNNFWYIVKPDVDSVCKYEIKEILKGRTEINNYMMESNEEFRTSLKEDSKGYWGVPLLDVKERIESLFPQLRRKTLPRVCKKNLLDKIGDHKVLNYWVFYPEMIDLQTLRKADKTIRVEDSHFVTIALVERIDGGL